jgi:hypothetical protein
MRWKQKPCSPPSQPREDVMMRNSTSSEQTACARPSRLAVTSSAYAFFSPGMASATLPSDV